MLLQTILNRVHKIKGFVYGAVRLGEWNGDPTLEVEVRPRAGSRGIGSGCGKKRPGYDRLDPRGGLNFCPSGVCGCSWCTGCGGWTARGAG